MELNIRSDLEEVAEKYKQALTDQEIISALAGALNAMYTAYKRETKGKVLATYNLRSKDFGVDTKTQRASPKSLQIRYEMRGEKLKLSRFENTQEAAGVRVNITTPKLIRRVFQANVKAIAKDSTKSAIHSGVFERTKRFAATSRGRYAGRVIKRGPKKGQLLQREIISEKRTGSVPGMVKAVTENYQLLVLNDDLLAKTFDEKLSTKLVNKQAKLKA